MRLLYTLKYNFHPIKEIKWAFQRVFRGWDDRVIWSIDWYLAKYIPVWIEELKKQDSCPILNFDNKTNEDWELNKKEWNKILDTIIDGFNAAEDIIDGNYVAWDEYFAEYEKLYGEYNILGDQDKSHNLLRELDTMKRIEKEEAGFKERFNNGMKLFTDYFFNLWS